MNLRAPILTSAFEWGKAEAAPRRRNKRAIPSFRDGLVMVGRK